MNPKPDSESTKTVLLKAAVIILCGLFTVNLFFLQILRGEEFSNRAKKYAVQSVKLPAARGEIYDRDRNMPFVTNEEAFSVEIVPAELNSSDREGLFARVSNLLGIEVDEVYKKIPEKYYHLYQPVTIASSVRYGTIVDLAEHKDAYPGVYWNSRPTRKYLDVGSLGEILGYVGEIGRDEYKMLYNKGYSSDDLVGKAGIEKQYDSLLKGADGKLLKTVDVKGKDLAEDKSKFEMPQPGKDLILTIDRNIQKIAEAALGQRMGSVVVLKPATGEILAMVSYPWYDPNIFSSNLSGSEFVKLLNDPNKPLLNRAIQSSYPPASTFKTVLTTAALEEKAISPTATVACKGVIQYGGRDWNCWIHRPGHGAINLGNALAQSCDIYYWTIGRDYLGVDNIVSYAEDFGFGKLTGVDLPGETPGQVPTPKWKEQTFNQRWSLGDTMNLSIGQGYLLTTPLQVADMMAMVVNNGTIYRPHLLKEIRDPETGAIIQSVEREEISRVNMSASTFTTLKEDLRGVITKGTAGAPLSTKVVQIAGKTGTAEIGLKDRWHSWFVSFGPYDAKPEDQVVVVTMIEASNPWEWWAPYAANVIYQAIFAGQDAQTAARTVGVSLSQTHVRGKAE
ncbi:MAG: penicillin-binding protein 2 [Spirochaetes bacterium]|nr:penicillin-binding protein 2 [Spirochaetota bacterium]